MPAQKAKKTLSFPASGSSDVVAYRLYIEPVPNDVTYESQSFELGAMTSVDLSTLPGMDTIDGVFNLGVTSIDDAGNESTSMSKKSNVPLDFIPPLPPGPILIS